MQMASANPRYTYRVGAVFEGPTETTAAAHNALPMSAKRTGCMRVVGGPAVVSSALAGCNAAAATSRYAIGYSG